MGPLPKMAVRWSEIGIDALVTPLVRLPCYKRDSGNPLQTLHKYLKIPLAAVNTTWELAFADAYTAQG